MAITAETRTDIIELVVGTFGAAPGANILSELADAVDAGLSLQGLTVAMVENPVFKNIYPSFLTNEEFATNYLTAIFGGEPGVGEVDQENFDIALDAVTALLNAGESRGEVVYQIINAISGVSEDDENFGAAAARLNNQTEVAVAYSVTTQQSGDTLDELISVVSGVDSTQASVDDALAVVNGTSNEGDKFILTAGADEITGTSRNDTFISGSVDESGNDVQTLSPLDILDGGSGDDTIKIFDERAAVTISSTTSVTSIENAVVNVALGFTADLADWTGLSNVNLQTVGGATDLTVDGIAVVGDNLDGNVEINDAGTVDLADVDGAATVDILTGTETTSVSVDGGAAVTIDADGAGANSTVLTTVAVEDNTSAIAIDSDALNSLDLNDVTGAVTIDNADADNDTLALAADDFDGSIVDTNDNYTDLDATIASDSAFALDMTGLENLTVAGSAVAAVTPTDLTNIEVISVLDEAGLEIDLSGAGASLETVDASGTSGDNEFVLDGGGTLATVSGGSGSDDVNIKTALTGTVDTTIDLGAGDDQFTLDQGIVHDGDTTIDGGDGTDTLALLDGADADTAGEVAIFSGFETLEVGGGTGTYELDLLGLTDIKISSALAGAVVLNDVAANASLLSRGATAATDFATGFAVTYTLDDATGTNDMVTYNLDAVDGDDDGTADGNVTVTQFIADGVETVTFDGAASVLDEDKASTTGTDESTEASDYTHVVTDLLGDSIETLNLTGDTKLTVTVDAANAGTVDDLSFVDATGNTAGVTVNVANVNTGVTFKGSTGKDTYTASANGDTIQAGTGLDSSFFGDSITLGGGADTVRYTSSSDSSLILSDTDDDGVANDALGFDLVGGFAQGTDTIELSSQLGLATGDARSAILQKGTVAAGAAALETFIGDGADFFDTGLVDRATAVLDDGTNTFLFVDTNANGDYDAGADGDLVIRLSGVVALDINDIQFG